MSTDSQYWLYQWLDSYMVKTGNKAAALLEERSAITALQEDASRASSQAVTLEGESIPSIMAGMDIDLSGRFSCVSWGCRRKLVDELFSRVWHYFDKIAVEAFCAHCVVEEWSDDTRDELLDHIRLLLYIRSIGAEDLLLFVNKPHPCIDHWERHAKEVGLQSAPRFAHNRVKRLLREAELAVIPLRDGTVAYALRHPSLPYFLTFEREEAADPALMKAELVNIIVPREVASLVSDIWASHKIASPLGSTYPIYHQLLRNPPSEANVAFHLKLPVLQGIHPELLLAIRRDEQEHFIAFRDSLRKAIHERLNTMGDSGAESIAREIESDVIRPSLNDIQRRLDAARKVLGEKGGLSLGASALATTCGLVTANPVLLGAGATAAAAALTAGYKYFDEQRDISLSDMYFLWKAQKHADQHR